MPTMEIDPMTVAASPGLLTVPALTDAVFKAVQAIRNIPGPNPGDPPAMTFWLKPDNASAKFAAGASATDWANTIPIRLFGANKPNAVTINGNPALGFGDGTTLPVGALTNGALIVDDLPVLPVGMVAWTLAFIMEVGAAGSGVPIGTADANGLSIGINTSTGYVSFTPQSANASQIVRPNVNKKAAGPQAYLAGFTPGTGGVGTLTVRNNGALAGQNAAALPLTNGRLRIGGFGLTTNQSSLADTKVSEIMTLSGIDLTAAGLDKYLGLVETRLRGQAGV